MGSNNYFKFKQFTVTQEFSAMKVGVDSVILGAWVKINDANTILDVGTGTGLLALMMAQRSNAMITAIEIDDLAYREAISNIQVSPWPDKIRVINSSFQDFAEKGTTEFDLIISNPPYFENSSQPEDHRRRNARHNDELPFADLINGSLKLLSEKGKLSLILPVNIAQGFCKLAMDSGLYINRTLWVRHRPGKPFHRQFMEFSKKETTIDKSVLVIEDQNEFTEDYKNLTREFYLAF
jgi:tRNA1Val (adenine37-N6)-methyltransferase